MESFNPREAVIEAVKSGLPASLVVPLPSKGGYTLRELREACRDYGTIRLTPFAVGDVLQGLTCVIDGVPNAKPVLALAMIVRDDTVGLERAIMSCIDQVDEIVIAVDARSNEATKKLALAYSDAPLVFQASDIGLSAEEWEADRIHFANARNFGRERVTAPWTLVIDADEMLATSVDIRSLLRDVDPEVGAFHVSMGTHEFEHRDAQRLARTHFRFFSATHNQLPIMGAVKDAPVFVTHDVSLRSEAEMRRRLKQRDDGMVELVEQGKKGDLAALFHAAKHYIGLRDERGVEMAADYRLRTQIHGVLAVERMWLAMSAAAYYHEQNKFREAEMWAVRVLMDGPRLEAFCILGDIAEDERDFRRALAWYECACVIEPEADKFLIPDDLQRRFERRDGLRKFLADRTSEGQPESVESVASEVDSPAPG